MWPRTARSHLRFEMRARLSVKYMSFRTEIAWEKDSQRFQNRSTLSERHIERTPHPNVFTRTWPIFAYLSSPDVVPQAPLLSPHSRRRSLLSSAVIPLPYSCNLNRNSLAPHMRTVLHHRP